MDLADEMKETIRFAIDAHADHARTDDDRVRFWDMKTPYAVHPVWCAMTLLTETSLPELVRRTGYKALLLHDVLEDTTSGLPDDLDVARRTAAVILVILLFTMGLA